MKSDDGSHGDTEKAGKDESPQQTPRTVRSPVDQIGKAEETDDVGKETHVRDPQCNRKSCRYSRKQYRRREQQVRVAQYVIDFNRLNARRNRQSYVRHQPILCVTSV